MSRCSPFKRHRFLPEIILLAVRWYCRYMTTPVELQVRIAVLNRYTAFGTPDTVAVG